MIQFKKSQIQYDISQMQLCLHLIAYNKELIISEMQLQTHGIQFELHIKL